MRLNCVGAGSLPLALTCAVPDQIHRSTGSAGWALTARTAEICLVGASQGVSVTCGNGRKRALTGDDATHRHSTIRDVSQRNASYARPGVMSEMRANRDLVAAAEDIRSPVKGLRRPDSVRHPREHLQRDCPRRSAPLQSPRAGSRLSRSHVEAMQSQPFDTEPR